MNQTKGTEKRWLQAGIAGSMLIVALSVLTLFIWIQEHAAMPEVDVAHVHGVLGSFEWVAMLFTALVSILFSIHCWLRIEGDAKLHPRAIYKVVLMAVSAEATALLMGAVRLLPQMQGDLFHVKSMVAVSFLIPILVIAAFCLFVERPQGVEHAVMWGIVPNAVYGTVVMLCCAAGMMHPDVVMRHLLNIDELPLSASMAVMISFLLVPFGCACLLDGIKKRVSSKEKQEAVHTPARIPSPLDKYQEHEALLRNVQPNLFVSRNLIFVGLILPVVWLLNEASVFAVNTAAMRTGCIISLLMIVISWAITCNKDMLQQPVTKYLLMGCALLACGVVLVTMEMTSPLVMLLPLMLTSQYVDEHVFWATYIGSLLLVVITPFMGIALGFWSPGYPAMLMELCGYQVGELTPVGVLSSVQHVQYVLVYLILPRVLTLSGFAAIPYSVVHKNKKALENYMMVVRFGETDALTGLLNRNGFVSNIDYYRRMTTGRIAVVYADANGLHRLNNEQGHSAGDKLLISCANALFAEFGSNVFRVGGDEFLAVVCDMEEKLLDAKIASAKKAVENDGYSMSVGVFSDVSERELTEILEAAEKIMMEDKAAYYAKTGYDRNMDYPDKGA